jgi:hypothetical protein
MYQGQPALCGTGAASFAAGDARPLILRVLCSPGIRCMTGNHDGYDEIPAFPDQHETTDHVSMAERVPWNDTPTITRRFDLCASGDRP